MKAVLSLLVILVTSKAILTLDDEAQYDNEQNMDGNLPPDQPNPYPGEDQNPMNNPDQMNYPPNPMNNPDQMNYPPNPMNNPDQMNYPPNPMDNPDQMNYPPNPANQDQMNYQNQMNYPPPQRPPPPPPPPQNDDIRCECGEIAKKTVVRKDTPNKGRGMYVCPRPQHDPERCNFFLWADQAGDGGGGSNYGRQNQGMYNRPSGSGYQQRNYYKPRNQNNQPSGGGNGQSYTQLRPNYGRPGGNQMNGPPQQSPNEDNVQCACGAPAKKFVVKKDTPNKGREFYACPRMRNDPERCNFFLWA